MATDRASPRAGHTTRARFWRPDTPGRLALGLFLAVVLPCIATWIAANVEAFDRFPGPPFLIATIAATLVGRFAAGLVSVLASGLLLAYFEMPPVDTLRVARPADVIALLVFAGLAVAVAYALAGMDRARADAGEARAEVEQIARKLAGERNTMQHVLRQMPGGVMVADARGRLTMANERARDILQVDYPIGHRLEEYPSMPEVTIRSLHPDGTPYRAEELPLARALATGEVVLGEPITIERGNGSTVMIEVDAAPIEGLDGATEGAVTTFQDVTDRLETQAQLERAARRLRQIQIVTDATLSGLGFDDLATRLLHKVREVLDTDSATLLLIDRGGSSLIEHATVGVDTEGRSEPVPVGAGIAGTIAAAVAPLVATDVSSHEVVRTWLTLKMHSLMGVPLVYRGRVRGVLHVATFEERLFTADDVDVLELVANRIASALERASLYDSRSAMSEALQQSLLPASLPQIDGVDMAALYLPFSPDDEIGGDFYDVFPQGEGAWGVVVGDVSGKGPEAAAIMGLAAHSVRVLGRYEPRPSRVLGTLNDLLMRAESVAEERFCTACEMRLRPSDDRLRVTICLAGHPLPFVTRSDGRVEQVGHPGTLLGAFPDPVLQDTWLDLEPGDALVAFTDGLVEHPDAGIDDGERRLAQILRTCAGGSPGAIVERVRRELIDGVLLDDDVALVVIACR